MSKEAEKEAGEPAQRMCKLLSCSCGPHTQDEIHGYRMRVHNWGGEKGSGGKIGWKCTVCGKFKEA